MSTLLLYRRKRSVLFNFSSLEHLLGDLVLPFSFPLAATITIYACFGLFADKLDSFRSKPWLVPSSLIAGSLGLLLCVTSSAYGENTLFGSIGLIALNTSIILYGYITFEYLVGMSLVWTMRAVIGSSILSSLMTPFYYVSELFSVAIPFVLCGLCLILVRRKGVLICESTKMVTTYMATEADKEKLDTNKARPAGKITGQNYPWLLSIGFLLLSLSFGFLHPFLFEENSSTVELITITTKIAAIAVFAFMVTKMGDTGYSPLAKLISSISILALVLFLLTGNATIGSVSLMATGHSLLEATYFLIMVNVAAVSRTSPIRVVSIFWLIVTLGYTLGSVVYDIANQPLAANYAASIFATFLTIAGIWVFTEKRINDFLWNFSRTASMPEEGQAEKKPRSSQSSFEDKINRLSEERSLSPREDEIMGMFASGRSAAFIAEATFVSTNTVRTHIKHIYAKLDVHSRQELISLIEGSE